MNCVFNTVTKKYTGTAIRWNIPAITADEVIIELPNVPDDTVRLNAANNAVRPATPVELGEVADQRKDAQVNSEFNDTFRVLVEEMVTAIQDGSITTKTPAQILIDAKARRKDEL